MLDMVSHPGMPWCKTSADIVTTDKPDETLESDSKFASGQNPMIGRQSPSNN